MATKSSSSSSSSKKKAKKASSTTRTDRTEAGRRVTVRTNNESDTVELLEEQLRAVRAIGSAFSSAMGLNALFEQIVPQVSRLMSAERTTLFLYDPSSNEIWSKVAEGEGVREIRLQMGQGIAGWAAEKRETVNIDDAYKDPRFNAEVDARTGFHTESVAATAMVDHQGKLLGVLQVLNHRGGPFAATHIGLLETISAQAAYAVENAHLAQQILDQNQELQAARHRAERRRAELDLLYQLERETSASSDLNQLLDSIIVRACQRQRSEAGSVLLLEGETGKLYYRSASGEHEQLRTLQNEPHEGIIGWVAQAGQSVIVNRPDEDPRHSPELILRMGYKAQAMLAVPLVWDGRVLGAVEVLNPRPRPTGAKAYDLEDLKVMTIIGGQVARAVALTLQRKARLDTERMAVIGRMLAGVAHDLRNPMTVISGYAQLMSIEDDEDERQQRCTRILFQVDEMTAMVGDLLAFARGDSTLRPANVSVTLLGTEVTEMLKLQCDPRGIVLSVDAEEGSANVDLARAKRILYNLAKNSVDVLSRGDKLDVQLREQEGGLLMQVKDNGPGIPEDIRAQVFEPFVSSGKVNGTGLGLSIVKRFVADHQGMVSVDSTEGKGTTFVVHLPEVSA